MEPLATLAITVGAFFFGEAIKEAGKSFGKSATEKIGQITQRVRGKWQAAGTEGLLLRAEKDPSKENIARVTAELEAQFTEDAVFHEEVQVEVVALEKIGFGRQEILRNAVFKGNLETGDISQKKQPGSPGEQSIGTGLQVEGDAKFGNLSQEG